MKVLKLIAILLVALIGSGAHAAGDLSGTWVLNTKKGENLGMVAAIEQTLVVTQTTEKLSLDYTNVFRGKASNREVNLDLSGMAVDNPAAMGDPSRTESVWDGDALVTTWKTEGAIPGTEVTRVEMITLSEDGSTMSIATERENQPTMTLVYERQ